jgi:hypothetical protein
MIYLYGKGREVGIVYDISTLTEEEKNKGILVEGLPEKEHKDGYYSVLCLDKNNKPYWIYEEIKTQYNSLEKLVINNLLTKEQYKTLTGKDFTF